MVFTFCDCLLTSIISNVIAQLVGALPAGRVRISQSINAWDSVEAATLIFHATDDTLQLYRNAQFAAATIPGARLVRFETGGHLVISVEQSTIRTITQKHIISHTSE